MAATDREIRVDLVTETIERKGQPFDGLAHMLEGDRNAELHRIASLIVAALDGDGEIMAPGWE